MKHWNVQMFPSVKEHAEDRLAKGFIIRGETYEVGQGARSLIVNLWQAAEWRRLDELNRPGGKGAAKIWKRIQKNLADTYFYWGVAEMMETGSAEVEFEDFSTQKIMAYRPNE